MAEFRNLERPGFFGKLLGKTLDSFGVPNDWQEGSTTWADAVRNSANYISPYNVGQGGNLEPQTPQAATDFIESNKGMMERMGRSEPEPLDGLMAFGLSSGVGGLGRRVEARAAGAVEPKPAMAFSNGDEKAALAAGAGVQPIRAYHGAKVPYEGDIYNPKKSQYKAFFAAESPKYASTFARVYDGSRVYPVDIAPDAKLFDYGNPAHTERLVSAYEKNPAILANSYLTTPDNIKNWMRKGDAGILEDQGVQRWLKKSGFDGWKFEDTAGPPFDNRTSYGMLRPGKVTSATTGETLFSNGDEKAGAALGAFGESSQPTMYRGVRMADKPGPISPDSPYYWMTSNPDLASNYALGEQANLHYQSPAVIPAVTDFKNPMTVDAQGQHWMNVPQADGGTRSTDGLAYDALRQGHDGLIVNNVNDAPYDGMPEHVSTVSAALQPGTVKSPLTGETLFSNADEKAGAFANAASNLPMDQASRMARAREMGFDTENPLYHGTSRSFDEFSPDMVGNSDFGASGRGFYFSEDPGTASAYAMLSPAGNDPQVIKAFAKYQNPYELDAALMPRNAAESQMLTDRIREQGYDAIKIMGKDGVASEVITFDPSNIRSVNAAFDPSKSDSANLLAANADEKMGAFAAAAGEPKGITAYHGSPHDFDKFSLDKIGTGEGAQAYGHGLYFADSEGVARSYRDALTGNHAGDQFDYVVDGQKVAQPSPTLKNIIRDYGKDPHKFIERMQPKLKALQEKVKTASPEDELGMGFSERDIALRNLAEHQKIIDEANGYIGKEIGQNPLGRMYQVRINADPDSFLDWDKPLSQQSEGVRPALEKILSERNKAAAEASGITGYEPNPASFANVGGHTFRSDQDLLREAGIPGIRYLDGNSRADGAGSSNYVVFDDSLIEILKKYGMAGGALGAGALLQSGDAGATPFGASTQTLIPPIMEQSLGAFGQPDDDQD